MKQVDIYTDGACSGNPGEGGWGVVLIYNGNIKELSGYEKLTTNNRMELLAAIKGLKALKHSCYVNLYSDSAYLINAFNSNWVEGWKKNGWTRGKKKEEVKNTDLWMELDSLSNIHKVKWIKVKGHSDNKYNNRCDELATNEIKINRNNRNEE